MKEGKSELKWDIWMFVWPMLRLIESHFTPSLGKACPKVVRWLVKNGKKWKNQKRK